MTSRSGNRQRGFSMIELSIICLMASVCLAFATPKIIKAMRSYRLSMATRQMADLVQKAKVEAVAENRKASLVVDTANRKFGLIVYDGNGAVIRTDYIPLPLGVNFSIPANNSAPINGAPSATTISFPNQNGSSTIFQQDFTSRGFLNVSNPATIQAVYFGDGINYRALTLTSVGGIRIWKWDTNAWANM